MYRLRGLTPQANTSIRHLYLPEVPITEEVTEENNTQ
jgi:hypothetical protein